MKKEIQQRLMEKSIEAIIITGETAHNPMLTYFAKSASFTKATIILLKGKDPILFYRPMERDNAALTGLKSKNIEDFPLQTYIKSYSDNPAQAEAAQLQDILIYCGVRTGRIAFAGRVEFGQQLAVVRALQELMPEVEIIASEGQKLIGELRYTKDEDEIAAIRKMGIAVTTVVGKVERYIKNCRLKEGKLITTAGEPVTIGDIKKKINLWLAEEGGENPEGTIFALGCDAGVPHNSGNNAQQLEEGKTIVFDFFPCEIGGGYFYDFTRTWCIGSASPTIQAAYNLVKKVHDIVIAEAKPGIPFKTLQNRTCELFQAEGHPTVAEQPNTQIGYVHSVGHGLGLNVHERPFSGFSAPDQDVLAPGVIFTIEPGLYYPEADETFGIRLEDTLMMTEEGIAQIIAPYPYQLVLDVPEYQGEK